MFADMRLRHPHLQENILAAMGNLEPHRLLDTRYLELDGNGTPGPGIFPIVTES